MFSNRNAPLLSTATSQQEQLQILVDDPPGRRHTLSGQRCRHLGSDAIPQDNGVLERDDFGLVMRPLELAVQEQFYCPFLALLQRPGEDDTLDRTAAFGLCFPAFLL